ncbi:MAG: DUF433 domain-containing protein [Caldilineaceae bacterium]
MLYQERVEKDDLDAAEMSKLAAFGGSSDWLNDPAEDDIDDDKDGASMMAETSTISFSPVDVAQYFEIQTSDYIRLKGHRIGIEDIVDDYNEGYTPEEIIKKYPGLDLKVIYAAIAYYLHHRCEVDAYIDYLEAKAMTERSKWERSRSSASLRVEKVHKERQQAYPLLTAQNQ